MPLAPTALEPLLAAIIEHRYFNQAGAPIYTFEAQQITAEDAANAWADALVTYCLRATAAGVPVMPADLIARQPVMATALASQFANNNDPAGASQAIFDALGDLWSLPPVVFPNGYVVTDVNLGKPAAVAAMTALGSNPSPVTLSDPLAAIIDTYLRTIIATFPGPPPVPVTLL